MRRHHFRSGSGEGSKTHGRMLGSGGREEGVWSPGPARHALVVRAGHHGREGLFVVAGCGRVRGHLGGGQLGSCRQLLVVGVSGHRVVPRVAGMVEKAFGLLNDSETTILKGLIDRKRYYGS